MLRCLILASLLLAAACGQKGDLYLPDAPAAQPSPSAEPQDPSTSVLDAD